ncbi:hypothetical protein KFE25_012298 [Diacronema lutheri]|uniref:Alpha 1,4-glycosyltransferase domain-containing protein n=1 Tax=Diacronema lutheri TaxID=2081491 RepID=A0A8J5XT39_DIALT|nr:hypothetical protein KFE25_012298 [Diacronema lutheri]
MAVDGAIPRVVHFVHGLATSAADVHFGYEHYLAVVAASVHIRPDTIAFHHHHVPRGEWWARAAPLLDLRRVPLPTEVFGRPLTHAAHRADVVRLRALLREGGIYLDMDVIALRSFDDLLAAALPALGKEGRAGEHGLCNAVIVAPAGAPFLARWLDAYRTFDGALWAEHSVALPMRLALAHPTEVRRLDADAFFWPLWDDAALRRLLLYREYDFGPNYATHLWAQAARPYVLSLWSPAFVAAVPSALNCRLRAALARRVAGGERGAERGDERGAAGGEPGSCGCAPRRDPRLDGAQGLRREPLHAWPLIDRFAFGPGGRTDARTRACFARDTAPAGCAHVAFFARGCAPAGEEDTSVANASDSADFAPYADARAGGARVLSWARGLEGFAAVGGEWQADFSISWWAAASAAGGEQHGGGGGGGGGGGSGGGEASGGARVLWSLVLAGGGELTASLERLEARAPAEQLGAGTAVELLEPVLRARGAALRAAPLACAGVRPRAFAVAADGGWHAYAAHARAGELLLDVDGRTVATARWAPGADARVVGLWVGTVEPSVAGRRRPTHALAARRADAEARGVPAAGGALLHPTQLAGLEVHTPSLRARAPAAGGDGATQGGNRSLMLMAPTDFPRGFSPPALVALPPLGWLAAGARAARYAPCDALASARAAPGAAALGALCWAVACAALARAALARVRCARARHRRAAGAAGLPDLGRGKAN